MVSRQDEQEPYDLPVAREVEMLAQVFVGVSEGLQRTHARPLALVLAVLDAFQFLATRFLVHEAFVRGETGKEVAYAVIDQKLRTVIGNLNLALKNTANVTNRSAN